MRIPAPPRRRANTLIITSLVDVMFVLLFFFMLTASRLDWGALPVRIGRGGTAAANAQPVLRLQLMPGGHLWLERREVPAAGLVAAIRGVARAQVVVQPAHGVPLQDLVDVVDRLRAADIAVSLGAAPGAQ
ncbi:MAG TPA: biopolymer transporter ExbD [Stenotrophobium sp.]|jgi:biopolymer transport protein ExbD|nr:biopolymer transporter ExbD [Stenotrophobium sp.]